LASAKEGGASLTAEAIEDLPTRKYHKYVTIDGVQKRNSHHVWFLNTGYWPDFENKREVIHHIDGDHQNDDFSNLQLMTNAEHSTLHNIGEGCIIDKMIGKCGPYRYHVTKHKGKQTWKYLGRTDRFEIGLVNDGVGKPMEGE
jgi:hypothetical protein